MIKHKYSILFILFFGILLLIVFLYMNIINLNQNFDRAVYSVVIHNCSNETIDNIQILYGRDADEVNSVVMIGEINNLLADEYRKINISTGSPSNNAEVPYNVWVSMQQKDKIINHPAGYFGVGTGGLALFKTTNDNGVITLDRIYQHENEYKKVYKRNKENQNELSWRGSHRD